LPKELLLKMERRNTEDSMKIASLIAGYLQSTLSEQQKEKLFNWIAESESNRRAFSEILDEQNLERYLSEFATYNATTALAKFKSERVVVKSMTRFKPGLRISAAASLLLVLSFGFWLHRQQKHVMQLAVSKNKSDVAPGGNRATLTLANGTEIGLDSASNGEIAQQGGVTVTKTKSGQVIYNLADLASSAPAAEGYNTIATPRGGQYQVILPDGSHVWLNAASSIRFPTVFRNNERKVEINGEAYFEVAKDKTKPFRVLSGEQTVEVLGTHFNVMAYDDEKAIITTLLEGSVAVSNQKGRVIIKPNQNVTMQRNGSTLTVNETDVEAAVMWKNGYFHFDDEPIEGIMRKISRWYNVEIVYKGNIAGKTFGGNISRFKNVSELLDVLQTTGSIHFQIKERRIIVMP
jgi:transmembrane sensor